MLDSFSFEHDSIAKILWTMGLVGLFFFFGSGVNSTSEFMMISTEIKEVQIDYNHHQSTMNALENNAAPTSDDIAKTRKLENKIDGLMAKRAEANEHHKLFMIGSYISLVAFMAGFALWYIGPYQRKKKDNALITQALELDVEIKKKELKNLNNP
ncbi:hypothetical protein ACTXIV_02435 [Psychrobacter celer]|uniref:hypothetical protein n=1 Tax=Psychrobacter celer TaxID=306572 RepID=UPI003FD56B91